MAKSAPGEEQFIIGPNGKKQGVILDIKWYAKLREAYEDMEDLRVALQRRKEKLIPLDVVEKELKRRRLA